MKGVSQLMLGNLEEAESIFESITNAKIKDENVYKYLKESLKENNSSVR